MPNRPLNPERSLWTYESYAGEHAFIRYQLHTIKEEIPGFSSAIRDRAMAEALFVEAEFAAQAEFALTTASPLQSLASVLDAFGIPHRRPGGVTAPVVELDSRRSARGLTSIDDVA